MRSLSERNTTDKGPWGRRFFEIVKENRFNWFALAFLFVAFAVLEYGSHPFERHITPRDWEDLKFPYESSQTIPSFAVPLYSIVLPILLATLYHVFARCEIREYHDLVYGILITVILTAGTTNAIKESIGRPRPNFFERCYEDTYNVTDKLPFDSFSPPDCTNPKKDVIREGRRSFPSGHSSWAAASMVYISLFLIGKLEVFSGRGQIWKLIISFIPVYCAVGVGITRINDYMHHWTDVVVGLLLGAVIATIVHLMYYPWPFAREGTGVPLYMEHKQLSSRISSNVELAMEEGHLVADLN